MEVDAKRIENKIASLFNNSVIIPLSRIETYMSNEYINDVYSVLGKMIENKTEVNHKKNNGYIIHRSKFYIFQPSERSEKLSFNKRSLIKVNGIGDEKKDKKISINDFLKNYQKKV